MRLRLGFAWARARATLPPLIALAAVSAVSAGLLVGTLVGIQVIESREVSAALSAAEGDRAYAVISAVDADSARLVDAVDAALTAHGVQGIDLIADGDHVTIVPDAARFTSGDAAALSDALRGLSGEVRDAVGVAAQQAGALDSTLNTIIEGLSHRRGATLVAIGMLALLTLVVVGAVALEPVRARSAETLLLRARGARRRTLLRLTVAETFAVSIVGAHVGAVSVWGATTLAALPSPGVVIVVVISLVVAVAATLSAAVVVLRTADARPGRAQAAAFAGAAVLLAVVTGLASWRFLQTGTPMLGSDLTAFDPLVAIAPALMLGAAALLAVLVATPLARLAAASVSQTRRVNPVTSLRLASRRPARHALPIAVVAIAIGITTVAAAYAGTVRALGDAPEALRVGADVRVASIPDPETASAIARTAEDAGATTTALARAFATKGSAPRIPVITLPAGSVGDVMLDAGGAIDPAALGAAIAPTAGGGIAVSGDAVTVTVFAAPPEPMTYPDGTQYQPDPPLANVRLTFASDAGQYWEHSFMNGTMETRFEGDQTWVMGAGLPEYTEEIALPAGESWSLLAVSSTLVGYQSEGPLEIAASVGGMPLDLSQLVPAPGSAGTVEIRNDRVVLTPTYTDRGQTLLTRAIAPGAPTEAGVVMTETLAAALSLDVGDAIDLDFDGPDFSATVRLAATVPVLPGTPTGQGMLADLDTLSFLAGSPISPNQLWVRTDAPDTVASAVSADYSGPLVLVADPRQGAAAAATAWGFVLAAVGAAVLALVVLWLRRTRTRADTRELALLTVLGLGRRAAGGIRAAEDRTAVALGVVGGLAAGALTAWLIVPPLVRAAYGTVPAGYPVPLEWPWVVLAVAVAVLAAVFALIVSSVRAPRHLAAVLREDE